MMKYLTRRIVAAAGALCILAGGVPAAAQRPPNPETLLCPPSSEDLRYAVYVMMEAAQFQEWEGSMSWRAKMAGPFHLPSLAPAEYLHVEFKDYRTLEGTRLVAVLWWQTRTYEFGVKQDHVLATFQQALDELSAVYPCQRGGPGR